MFAKKRRFEPAVIERLFREPYRFEYFHAVRVLELWLKRHGLARQGRQADLLRFQNTTSLAFPSSQVAAVQAEPRGIAPDAAALGEALRASWEVVVSELERVSGAEPAELRAFIAEGMLLKIIAGLGAEHADWVVRLYGSPLPCKIADVLQTLPGRNSGAAIA